MGIRTFDQSLKMKSAEDLVDLLGDLTDRLSQRRRRKSRRRRRRRSRSGMSRKLARYLRAKYYKVFSAENLAWSAKRRDVHWAKKELHAQRCYYRQAKQVNNAWGRKKAIA